ncbi:RING-H2 finger protein ATL70 [Nicotiana tabacum]|uniref:RING-H2 finger protein ATL70 n=3 Tax=Nicotiana tabacum TaxID=4097 RepID=A0AC58TFD0_TOBAC|nr:RING-H2 finger protein ATL70-like [Nicotiana tomentosiformis]XP_016439418.1 PREDICTED: RING-H2 finger protein ATL70-like [Nicotiana tabacum]
MNSTAISPDPNSDGFLGSQNIGGFAYGIGVSVGILLLITTITLTSYFCTRHQTTVPPQRTRQRNENSNEDVQEVVVEVGLDEETLLSYPKLLYSEAKVNHKDSTATCCSICLADYKNSDMLRLLPDCGHLFHLKCVDPWLRLNPTCPVCRTSPLPTPQSTPLAEVVPLATRPIG